MGKQSYFIGAACTKFKSLADNIYYMFLEFHNKHALNHGQVIAYILQLLNSKHGIMHAPQTLTSHPHPHRNGTYAYCWHMKKS